MSEGDVDGLFFETLGLGVFHFEWAGWLYGSSRAFITDARLKDGVGPQVNGDSNRAFLDEVLVHSVSQLPLV